MNSPEKEKREQETYESFFAGSDQQKSPLRPQPKNEWSEEDEKMFENFMHKLEVCDLLTNKEIAWAKLRLKSLRPQPHEEIYQSAKHDLAIRFMNYLDENRPEGKMGLSNGECGDIDKAFKENDWAKILRYAEKYGK